MANAGLESRKTMYDTRSKQASSAKASTPRKPINSPTPATLFGQPIAEPMRRLVGQYPFSARLNEHWLRRCRESSKVKNYGKGILLFAEGVQPDGVIVILDGQVKKSITSSQGKTLVLGFFGPGTVLGLAASVLERAHTVTAETVEATKALFVPRLDLIKEIQTNATAAWQVAQLLSENYYFVTGKIRNVDLCESAPQKIARCLLGLVAETASASGEHVHLQVSQETVAQMVGIARETVSRQLSQFRRKGVLDWTRSDFVIRDRQALEEAADLPEAAA